MQKKLLQEFRCSCFCRFGLLPSSGCKKQARRQRPVQMTVTFALEGKNKRMPEVTGRHHRQARQRTAAGHRLDAGRQRARAAGSVHPDRRCRRTKRSSQFGDLREFIHSPPNTTSGVGYMRNGTTYKSRRIDNRSPTGREGSANSARLPGRLRQPVPFGDRPDEAWPETQNRREIVMITDGIDRLHRWPHRHGFASISPDVDSASTVAQHTGTIIHSIYTRGVGSRGNNFWEVTNGQNAIAKLADETGGESFFLGDARSC